MFSPEALDGRRSCEPTRLDPKYGWACGRRGEVYRLKVDNDRAIVDFNHAIRLDPKLGPAEAARSSRSQTLPSARAAAQWADRQASVGALR
jgi:hypothetical protein